MRVEDHVYVLTTMLIILIWCFSVNWLKLQEAAKTVISIDANVLLYGIMGGIKNNAGQGLNIVLANGESGEVLRNKNFNLESRDPEELLVYLKTLKPGNIVRVASHIDPTPKLTDEIREIFTALGSTVVKSLKPRDSWVFTGAYGINEASPFEKLIQNDMRSNVYEDWPEMGEIIGCFPRISETE
ncbi:protein FAM3C [Sinocyclocheilus grahami]|uniref:protein FAM3C n=1 Tax=Sinocyclocheilus grahami TaxID=75366 RepID=UPI0007AD53AE|nr:PREDICTED: protein FAM3C-like [Sinocyclocheilus grahami]